MRNTEWYWNNPMQWSGRRRPGGGGQRRKMGKGQPDSKTIQWRD